VSFSTDVGELMCMSYEQNRPSAPREAGRCCDRVSSTDSCGSR
jgi:hypothetical protein